MRIISGQRRGMKLIAPKSMKTRPTEDRIKENVFNLLGPIEGRLGLELFAGSGQIGLEFLSRGLDKFIFVDSSSEAIKCIKENIAKAKLDDRSLVQNKSWEVFLGTYAGEPFDYVYLDPPYEYSVAKYEKILEKLERFLHTSSKVVIEHNHNPEEISHQCYKLYKSRTYGEKTIEILEKI